MFKKYDVEHLALLRLHLEPEVSLVLVRYLFEAFDTPSDIFKASAQKLCCCVPSLPSTLAQRLSARQALLSTKRCKW